MKQWTIYKSHKALKKIVKCEKCDDRFASKNYRDKHSTKIHNTAYNIKCKICGKEAKTKRLLKHHMKLVHNKEKEYKCEFCDKCFHAQSYLYAHIRRHPGMGLHKCDPCQKEFAQKREYTNHMNSIGHQQNTRGENIPLNIHSEG